MNNEKMVSGLGVSKGYKLDFSRKEYKEMTIECQALK